MEVLLFFLSFTLYLFTLYPTIAGVDGPEFVIAGFTLGITHPPGTPLYDLLCRIFTLIPLGEIAYRANLFSAILASATVSVVYRTISIICKNNESISGKKYIFATIGSLCLAFSYTFWSQAIKSEVYALYIFFLSILLLVLAKFKENFRESNSLIHCSFTYLFILSSFIVGVIFVNHITSVVLFPGIFIFLITYLSRNKKETPNLIYFVIVSSSFIFLVSLTIFLYLLIRSNVSNVVYDFGNPENFKNFIEHITATQYKSISQIPSLSTITFRLWLSAKWLIREFNIFWIAIGTIGFIGLLKYDFRLGILFLFSILALTFFGTTVFGFENATDMLNVLTPNYLIFSIAIGVGVSLIYQKYKLSTILLSILFLGFLLITNYRTNNKSDYRYFRKIGVGIFRTLENNSVALISNDNYSFPMLYLQIIENYRKDVQLILTGVIITEWYLDKLKNSNPDFLFPNNKDVEQTLISKKVSNISSFDIVTQNKLRINSFCEEFIKLNIDRFIIYWQTDFLYKLNIEMIPQGPLFLILKNKIVDSDIRDKMIETHYKLLNEFEKTVFDNYQTDFSNLSFKITNALSNLYLYRYNFWIAKGMYDNGILECQKMIRIFPDYSRGYIGLGNIYSITGRYDSAMNVYQQALKLFPKDSEIYNNIGNIYLEQNENENAVQMYKKSIKLKNNSKDVHFNLGIAYMKLGHFTDAEKEFIKSIKIYPNDDESHKQLSFIYLYHLNNKDKALYHLKKVLEINPDSSDKDEIMKIINQIYHK